MLDQTAVGRSRVAHPRVLIIGGGDIGLRVAQILSPRFKVFATTTRTERFDEIRASGAHPILLNLDSRGQAHHIAHLADYIIVTAPPQTHGHIDQRSRQLAAILPHKRALVYLSTTGVYGDCQGDYFDETRRPAPVNARAKRRLDAETVWRAWGRRTQSRVAILRVPGIYSGSRSPTERLQKGLPALIPEQDVYTNHIHAHDLARITIAALFHGGAGRIYHAVDDSDMKMGDYFDRVADCFQLPRARRLPREALRAEVSEMQWSFMSESRRLANQRIKHELGIRLQFPDITLASLQAV